MKPKDLDYFKDLLTNWLDELLNQAEHTVIDLKEAVDAVKDPLDQAVFESDRSFTLRIRDREHLLINKIQQSLEDIEDGVYGICEDCGREISVERLKARPVARRCIRCKTKSEMLEKLTGS